MTKIPSIEQMLKAGMHFGHRTSKWHPKMKPYIFTSRNGVHIINLIKSKQMLGVAIDFIEQFSAENKTILFVGTKAQVKDKIKNMAIEIKMPYVTEKWLGGFLTNFTVIKKMIIKYNTLISDKESGKLIKYTKKEQLDFDREIIRLENKVGGLKDLKKVPDAIFIWDIKNEKTTVTEAKKKNIPIIAICDTNVNPDGIKYTIPSNDDATKTVKLLLTCIKEAVIRGKEKNNK